MAPISCPSLPEELLELILQRVTDIVDLYQCSNICHSWRSIARKQSALLPPQLLVLRNPNNVIDKIQMINMFTGSSSVCKIPEFNTRDGVRYMPMTVESSHGWLVMNYNTSKSRKVEGHLNYICLYNPLSREEIRLPPLLLNSENPRFILSSKPTNPSCIVLALHEKKLVFWRFGDKKWTFLKNVEDWINDIICYKDEFHVLQMKGNPPFPEVPYLLQVKFSPKCHVKSIPTKANRSFYFAFNYLVKSLCGNLWMVCRVLGNLGTFTLKFQVYKLHWKMMKWEKIKSLGDQAIFLACNDSVCVQADESTVYKKNCIYFTDDLCNGRSPSKEFGMYDLGNETMNHLPFLNHDKPCYRWFKLDIYI